MVFIQHSINNDYIPGKSTSCAQFYQYDWFYCYRRLGETFAVLLVRICC